MKALLSNQGPEHELSQCDRLGRHAWNLTSVLSQASMLVTRTIFTPHNISGPWKYSLQRTECSYLLGILIVGWSNNPDWRKRLQKFKSDSETQYYLSFSGVCSTSGYGFAVQLHRTCLTHFPTLSLPHQLYEGLLCKCTIILKLCDLCLEAMCQF